MANIKFCEARFHAADAADSAHAAYWDDSREAFHAGNMSDSINKLAGVLGLTIIPADPATARAVIRQIAPSLGLLVSEEETPEQKDAE